MERKYYEAYDDRYRQIHGQGLQWFDDGQSAIVQQTAEKFGITTRHRMLELGCGEGRDAFPLLNAGFDLLATDISGAAIAYCRQKLPQYAQYFQVLDCVAGRLEGTFDFIYAVAVVHMLVPDEDRDAFYSFIRDHLAPGGVALICTMGDGSSERQTDIRTAFDIQNRIHGQTGKTVQIASTSCRMVSFETLRRELARNGLAILDEGVTTIEPDFSQMMYAVVKRPQQEL